MTTPCTTTPAGWSWPLTSLQVEALLYAGAATEEHGHPHEGLKAVMARPGCLFTNSAVAAPYHLYMINFMGFIWESREANGTVFMKQSADCIVNQYGVDRKMVTGRGVLSPNVKFS